MGNENDNRTNLRAMAKTKTPPPPAVVITLDTDPFQVDVTTSNSHHPHVNQNHSQSNHHIHQNTQKSLSTHRDSLRVDSADSAVVKTNGGVGSSTATTGVRETGGSLCNARSRENSIGFEASAAGSSIDLNAFVGEQLAQEIAVSRKCCTENSRKVAAGVLMTVLIALSWVGAAHCLKGTYNRPRNRTRLLDDTGLVSGQTTLELGSSSNQSDEITQGNDVADGLPFDAPFFTTWLCTAFNVFFLPVFLIGRQCWSRGTTCRVIIFCQPHPRTAAAIAITPSKRPCAAGPFKYIHSNIHRYRSSNKLMHKAGRTDAPVMQSEPAPSSYLCVLSLCNDGKQ